MTRDEIRSILWSLEQAGEGDIVPSRKLCRDALTLLREIAAVNLPTISCMMEIIDEMDRERKGVKS